MRTEGAKEGAGNEVGTRMERTMYPGSGLSVEIRPLVLPECMMYMDGLQGCSWSCIAEEEEGAAGSSLPLLCGWCVCVCDKLTDPLHGGGPGGFIDEPYDLQYG